jgi:branched-chain amino acid transport system permease protein
MLLTLSISPMQLYGQLLIGLINGSFYALLSLGLAVIFGMLNVVNFAHGAFYMVGAFVAYFLLTGIDLPYAVHWAGGLSFDTVHLDLHINYWFALILAPLIVGLLGALVERLFIRRIAGLDHLYGLLLTFGLALVIQGLFQNGFGSSGKPYPTPPELGGVINTGFMFLPKYRAWVIVASLFVCLATWFAIEKTRLGAYLRAATENPALVRAFGINVPLMITATYGFGVALAAFAGVLAAPIYQVRPGMGQDIIAVVFAVVVIGGMGSILGSILTGFALGVIEGLTKVFYPEISNTVVFVIMAIVLIIRPSGLFGRVA